MRNPAILNLRCSECAVVKPIDDYPPRWGRVCAECRRAKQRAYRRTSDLGRTSCKRYEKTLKGYIMRQYRNMLSRVQGVFKPKSHLYAGLPVMPRHEYYQMALNSEAYKRLFAEYKNSGWMLRFAPTPDRVDSSKGYVGNNVVFITHGENSRRGALSDKRKRIKGD